MRRTAAGLLPLFLIFLHAASSRVAREYVCCLASQRSVFVCFHRYCAIVTVLTKDRRPIASIDFWHDVHSCANAGWPIGTHMKSDTAWHRLQNLAPSCACLNVLDSRCSGQVYKKVMAGERPRNLLRVKDCQGSKSGRYVLGIHWIQSLEFIVHYASWLYHAAPSFSWQLRQDELLRGIVMQCSRMVGLLSWLLVYECIWYEMIYIYIYEWYDMIIAIWILCPFCHVLLCFDVLRRPETRRPAKRCAALGAQLVERGWECRTPKTAWSTSDFAWNNLRYLEISWDPTGPLWSGLIIMVSPRIQRVSVTFGDRYTHIHIHIYIYILPLGLSRINRPEVVSHLRARSVSYRFWEFFIWWIIDSNTFSSLCAMFCWHDSIWPY